MKDILAQEDLRKEGIRMEILRAIDYAFKENEPSKKVKSFLEKRTDLHNFERIFIIGFGKAAFEMYVGAHEVFGKRINYGGIIIPEDMSIDSKDCPCEIFYGTHPFLSDKSLKSSENLLSRITPLSEKDLVLVLISGGGSSLFEVLEDGITLEKYREMTKCMMDNGADIYELNALRISFSKVKGGKLRNILYPAKVVSLIISDVPGDDLRFIASGPLSDPPDYKFVKKTFNKFAKKCNIEFTFKENPVNLKLEVENNLILSNKDFVDKISEYLESNNYRVLNFGSGITGNVSEVSRLLHDISVSYFELIRKHYFFVGGGETTVNVKGNGIGGRNLELCLRFILKSKTKEKFIFSSIGTDGIDGPSNVMGGIVDNETAKMVPKKKIKEYLSRSESLEPLKRSRDVIISGRTGNNVSDIFIGFIDNIG